MSLHPLAVIVYFLALASSALLVVHPVYQGLFFFVLCGGMLALRAGKELRLALSVSLGVGLFLVIINILVSRNGSTTIFETESIPLYGPLFITLEALAFGLAMVLRLSVIILLFALYRAMLTTDETFEVFSRFAPRSSLLVILSSLFLPQLQRRLREYYEICQLRGARVEKHKVKSWGPIAKLSLLSSLEDSWKTAEALHARGYGLTQRSTYAHRKWKIFDVALLISAVVLFSINILAVFWQCAHVEFYPTFDIPFTQNHFILFGCYIFAMIPLLVALSLRKRIEHGAVPA